VRGRDDSTNIPFGMCGRRSDLLQAIDARAPTPPNYRRGALIIGCSVVLAGLIGLLIVRPQFVSRH